HFIQKWRATFSSVILVETDDPKRLSEIFNFLASRNFEKWKDHQILHYDIWEGLRQCSGSDEDGNPLWENRKVKSDNVFSSGGRISLAQALDAIDDEIKIKKTIAVITGIIAQDDALTLAVNNWTVHPRILSLNSAVIIMATSRTILPQDTLLQVILAKPQPSTEKEREIIVKKLAEQLNLKEEGNGLVKTLAGLNLHKIESTLLESFHQFREFNYEAISSMKREQVNKLGILTIEEPNYGMERVGGYNAVKEYIQRSIIDVMKNTSLAQKLCLDPTRGVLLFGMGGTGKTLLARGLAKDAQLPFFKLQTSDIFSKYVGESERKIRSAVEIIEENAPCTVFIDEIEQLGHRTEVDGDSGTSRRVFSHILEWLGREERKAIIIGATNAPEFLDEAFLREGRFEVSIPMLLPEQAARRAIFDVHLHVKRKLDVKPPTTDLQKFAELTAGVTGAEIEGMVIRASRTAFDSNRPYLMEQDLEAAIKSYNINPEERRKSQEKFLETAQKICRDKQFLRILEQEHAVKSRTDILKERIQ
ncbi:MAG: ATP-binding protein, partial [Candidatus Methanofastidiosia archaeon]